jgi:hypothetical protein
VESPPKRLPPDPAPGRPRGSLTQATGGPHAVQIRERSAKRPRGRPFPRGISGNPAGRPPGITDQRILRRELLAQLARTVKGKTVATMLAEAIVATGLTGDVAAFREIADRVDGKEVPAEGEGWTGGTPRVTVNVLQVLRELPVEQLRKLRAAVEEAESTGNA